MRFLLLVFLFLLSPKALAGVKIDPYLLSDEFEASVDKDLYPYVMEFIQMAQENNIDTSKLKYVRVIAFEPDRAFAARAERREVPSAVAITDLWNPVTDRLNEIHFTEYLREDPEVLRVIVFHELLHALYFNHPKKECNWNEEGCGIMGRWPSGAHLNYNRLIHYSMRKWYLNRLPKINGYEP